MARDTASPPPHTQPPNTVDAGSGAGLGVYTDLVTAGALLGIGRTKAHELARSNDFPVPVLRHGRRYVVPVAPIARLLQLTELDLSGDNTDTA